MHSVAEKGAVSVHYYDRPSHAPMGLLTFCRAFNVFLLLSCASGTICCSVWVSKEGRTAVGAVKRSPPAVQTQSGDWNTDTRAAVHPNKKLCFFLFQCASLLCPESNLSRLQLSALLYFWIRQQNKSLTAMKYWPIIFVLEKENLPIDNHKSRKRRQTWEQLKEVMIHSASLGRAIYGKELPLLNSICFLLAAALSCRWFYFGHFLVFTTNFTTIKTTTLSISHRHP